MAAPASHAIEVRRPALDIQADIPRYWNDGRPFATHFLNALSSVFPDGEAFFVRSVLHYRERIDDPDLLERIRGFAGQEGQHSHHHARHVQLLVDQGYAGIEARNRLLARLLPWAGQRWPRMALAGTAALEHLTALLARRMLSEPERWTGRMDPRMAALWQWHALEEAEHKAVAYDVLQRVAPNRGLRSYALATNTVGLFVEVLDRALYMLWKDGLLFRRATWTDGWRFLFGGSGANGFLRGLGPDYWPWYRAGFHPDEFDDSALIEAARRRYS